MQLNVLALFCISYLHHQHFCECNVLCGLPFLDSSDDYTSLETATVTFTSGSPLPAVECLAIATQGDLLLEGDHQFSAHVYSTSEVGSSLITILSTSATTVVTITDDDGEKNLVQQ